MNLVPNVKEEFGPTPSGDRRPSYDPEISKLFFFVCLIIPVMLIVALFFYRDPFSFWHTPFSRFGQILTEEGRGNLLSRLVFSAGLIASGVAILLIGVRYVVNRALRNRSVKAFLAFVGSIGFFVAITPNDLNHLWHSIGMGILFGTMFFFALFFLVELRSSIPHWVFYWNTFLLLASVLSYAGLFFIDSEFKQMAQKGCVIGLLLVMEKAITIAPEGFEWRAAIQAMRSKTD